MGKVGKSEGKKRRKKLLEAQAADTSVPRSFVIGRDVPASVNQLVLDMRAVMSPYTALKLKVRKKNVLKDFVAMAGQLIETSHCQCCVCFPFFLSAFLMPSPSNYTPATSLLLAFPLINRSLTSLSHCLTNCNTAGPLGVSHLLAFSKTSVGTNLVSFAIVPPLFFMTRARQAH